MRGGTWNMLRDRDPDAAAVSALAMMRSRDLDFLCVQECAGYIAALRTWAGADFDVVAFHGAPGRAESALIVRAAVDHGPGYQVKATRAGWVTVRGGKTPPKYLTTVELENGLRVVSGHTAPSVKWRGGRILGPARRVLSMRQFARSVVRFAKNHRGPLLVACDWNATPDARGRYSPHWIARKAGMRIAAPGKPTLGNRTVDFALIRDCSATAVREKRRGSDHYAVTFKVGP
jgi:hypothetical protein